MTKRAPSGSSVKLFLMKGLMLEHDLMRLEDKGIEIGHKETVARRDEGSESFKNFDVALRNEAVEMASYYQLYYCLENSIRQVIREQLQERHGENWWDNVVPEGVRKEVEKKRKDEKDTPMTIRSQTDPLVYTSFGELISIVQANWADFGDIFRSPRAVEQTLSGLNKIRNVIAHNCPLSTDEIVRLKLAVRDWFRIQS